MPAKASEAERDEMVRLYLTGLSGKEAGRVVGRSEALCLRVLKERGIDAKQANPWFVSQQDRERIVDLYHIKRKTLTQIANDVGCCSVACRQIVKAAGVYRGRERLEERRAESERWPCSTCQIKKPIAEFNTGSSICRTCRNKAQRGRYHQDPTSFDRTTMAHKEALRRRVNELKRSPCVDCGSSYELFAMEFDHLHGKTRSISEMVSRHCALSAILEEVAKTELVCVLCHRLRTATRDTSRTSTSYQGLRRQSGRAFIQGLKSGPCLDCAQVRDPVQMDFDHRPGEHKRYTVSRMTNLSRETIMAEVAKCDLVCVLCHRRRTFARGFIGGRKRSAASVKVQ